MKEIEMEKWIIDRTDKAGEFAFNVMVLQSMKNPDAIEALYG